MRSRWLALLCWSGCLFGVAQAQNWPNWRGPTYDGCAAGTGYPLRWSQHQNLAWRITLPGGNGSTPAVWENRIFLTVCGEGRNLAICYDGQGKQLWQRSVGDERPGKHRKGSGANPSPVVDGQNVYVYFKSGDLACLNLLGDIV